MTHLFIDREATELTQTAQTWAELLVYLDAAMDARGRVLTEVRFDGVDEPTFRDASALARPLASVRRIDAETATPDELLKDCLLEAAGTIAGLREESARIADRFRSPDPGDGHQGLAYIARELGQLLVLVQTLQGPLGLTTAGRDERPGAERTDMARLAAFVEALLDAQEGSDYYTTADILEDDLQPFLRAWQDRFEQLAG